MKTFAEVIEYLYARLPMFTRDGASAINPDVDKTLLFCEALGNPHHQFKSIHIAGTNGKGSSSHMLAAVLQTAGYKTGLYTSPHLVDFRERIRLDGEMIPQQFVVDFVNQHLSLIETLQPSFFEVTVAMAFHYFAIQQVDVAVIEVGLGGRLDSTNIIRPEISLITNIGMDHMNILGNTLVEIAREKAGIIKKNIPVVISQKQAEISFVFDQKAKVEESPITYGNDCFEVLNHQLLDDYLNVQLKNKQTNQLIEVKLDLTGSYQLKNIIGVLTIIDKLNSLGYSITEEQKLAGLKNVQKCTGLQGRWQTLSKEPYIIADTGHNEDGIQEVLKNLAKIDYKQLHIVFGAMRDKDLSHILPILPASAQYYFAAPEMPRAMPAEDLQAIALDYHLKGNAYPSIGQAFDAAKHQYRPGDLIFIGGSTFVVAEILTNHF